MHQYDFVKQVYYLQEKVLLDFYPTDDKYQEVICEANFVIQELQKEADWTWLREQVELGHMDSCPGDIPEFQLPEWVYKVSSEHRDCVHLHRCTPHSETGYDQYHWIEVPYVSVGRASSKISSLAHHGMTNVADESLGAVVIDNNITFTRPPTPIERHTIAVTDVQRRIPLMTTRDDIYRRYPDLDEDAQTEMIEALAHEEVIAEVPDPNYVLVRTAALHCVGSPPAQARQMDLTDQAQKLLSAMRSNDSLATDSDYVEWEPPAYIEMI